MGCVVLAAVVFAQLPAGGGGVPSEFAGWTGTTLLSGVLGWLLFKHLPAKDRQTETLIANHNTQTEAVIKRFDARLDAVVSAHTTAVGLVVKHCDDEMKEIVSKLGQELQILRDTFNVTIGPASGRIPKPGG